MLRGLAKLAAVVLVAGLGGLAIGTALSELSGGSSAPSPTSGGPEAALPTSTTTGGPREAAPPTTTTESDPPQAVPPTTATTPVQSERRASTVRRRPATDVRVRIVSAVLHPAATRSGRRQQRARLSVHVRLTNRGSRRIVPPRPVLASGGVRVKTDAAADAAGTTLRTIAPGATREARLRFEIYGAVTKRVRQRRRARLIIAGRNVTASVLRGRPVAVRRATRRHGSSATAPPPPPPPAERRRSTKPPLPLLPPPATARRRPAQAPPPPPPPARRRPATPPPQPPPAAGEFDSSG